MTTEVASSSTTTPPPPAAAPQDGSDDWLTMLNNKDLFGHNHNHNDSDSESGSEENETTTDNSASRRPSSWNTEEHRTDILERLNNHGLSSLLDNQESDSDDEEGEVTESESESSARNNARRRKRKVGRKKPRRCNRKKDSSHSNAIPQREMSFASMPDLASCNGSVVDFDLDRDMDDSIQGSIRDFVESRMLTTTMSHSSGTWLGNGWEEGLESIYGMDDDTIYSTLTKQGVIIEGMPTPEPVKPMGGGGEGGFDVNVAVNHLTKCAQVAGIGQDEVVNILERLIAEHDAKATKAREAAAAAGGQQGSSNAPQEIEIQPQQPQQSEIQFSPKEFEVSRPIEFEAQRQDKPEKVTLSIDGTEETSPISRPESSESGGMDDSEEWNVDPARLLKVAGPGATAPEREEENSLVETTSIAKQAETASVATSFKVEQGIEMSHLDDMIPSNPPFSPVSTTPFKPPAGPSTAPSTPASPPTPMAQPSMPVPQQMIDPIVPDKPKSLFSRIFGCFTHSKPV